MYASGCVLLLCAALASPALAGTGGFAPSIMTTPELHSLLYTSGDLSAEQTFIVLKELEQRLRDSEQPELRQSAQAWKKLLDFRFADPSLVAKSRGYLYEHEDYKENHNIMKYLDLVYGKHRLLYEYIMDEDELAEPKISHSLSLLFDEFESNPEDTLTILKSLRSALKTTSYLMRDLDSLISIGNPGQDVSCYALKIKIYDVIAETKKVIDYRRHYEPEAARRCWTYLKQQFFSTQNADIKAINKYAKMFTIAFTGANPADLDGSKEAALLRKLVEKRDDALDCKKNIVFYKSLKEQYECSGCTFSLYCDYLFDKNLEYCKIEFKNAMALLKNLQKGHALGTILSSDGPDTDSEVVERVVGLVTKANKRSAVKEMLQSDKKIIEHDLAYLEAEVTAPCTRLIQGVQRVLDKQAQEYKDTPALPDYTKDISVPHRDLCQRIINLMPKIQCEIRERVVQSKGGKILSCFRGST